MQKAEQLSYTQRFCRFQLWLARTEVQSLAARPLRQTMTVLTTVLWKTNSARFSEQTFSLYMTLVSARFGMKAATVYDLYHCNKNSASATSCEVS
eukprot:4799876-Amphidinium_carterae.1